MKLKLTSLNRHRASAVERRLHGGRTVTEFICEYPAGTWHHVMGYGPTPGERKTYARKALAASLGIKEEE